MTDTLVLDLGTGSIKCGNAADSLPGVVFPNIVGHRAAKAKSRLLRKSANAAEEDEGPSVLVGENATSALRSGGAVTVKYPIEHGVVKHWDEMEHVFNRCFEDMQRDPTELSIVMTVPAYNPPACTERLIQTMFESFEVERFATVPQGLCALYASGRTTGVVLDSGDGITTVTPVFDSFPIDSATNRINVGGGHVTQHFKRVMYERGYNFSNVADVFALAEMKENLGCVSGNYQVDLERDDYDEDDYELPDGTNVRVGKERFRCTEILFNPSIVQDEHLGMGELVANAVKACGIDTRREISSNIVLSGGNTLFPGFASRLQDEVAQQFPGMFGSVHVIDAPDRKYNVWSGASVLAAMPSFEPYFITRDVYDDVGPSVVHGCYNQGAAADGTPTAADA